MPHAVPTCAPAASIVEAQNGPSHQDANPIASENDSTDDAIPGATVPEYSRILPRLRPAIGMMRRPNLAPYDRVNRSDTQPPIGIMIPMAKNMIVVYRALWV